MAGALWTARARPALGLAPDASYQAVIEQYIADEKKPDRRGRLGAQSALPLTRSCGKTHIWLFNFEILLKKYMYV